MHSAKTVKDILQKYPRSSGSRERILNEIANRQKDFKKQAQQRALTTESLLRCYNV